MARGERSSSPVPLQRSCDAQGMAHPWGSIAHVGQMSSLKGFTPGTGSSPDPLPTQPGSRSPAPDPAACRGAADASTMQPQGHGRPGVGTSQAARAPPGGSGAEKSWGCLTPRRSPARAALVPRQRKLLHKQLPSLRLGETHVQPTVPMCSPLPVGRRPGTPTTQPPPTTAPPCRVQPATPHPCAWHSSLQGRRQRLPMLPA